MDRNSKIKEIYANPIGHDVIDKLLMTVGKKSGIITNPVIGNIKLKTLEKMLGDKVGSDFFDALLTLLNSEHDRPVNYTGDVKPAWWKEAVFYQIYPRSFCDGNGDGLGDIPGIISKLDYLKELGVDALWLSPVYDSPQDDNGYDIRDYRKIYAPFGTMEDFDTLLNEVHKRDMKLIMDLVVNHTSDEHEWFKKGLSDPDSKYRDYYFFKPSGKEYPNNWTSFFSGPAWNRYEQENVDALHLFSKKQMDLNWDNPDVRDDVIDMVNWWLDKGVDGFRMDVINYISKEQGLPDGDPFIGGLMGYTGVEKYFYGPNLHKYLKEIKARAFEPHNAFSVGETPGLGMEMCKLVTAGERHELDMVFSFDHLETPGHTRFEDYKYDLNYLRDFFIDWCTNYGNNCRVSLFFNNHDNPRMISKVNPDPSFAEALAKLLAVIQFTLPGTPFMFQGDEMGLTNIDFKSMDEIEDVEARGYYAELTEKMSAEEAFKIIVSGTREHTRKMIPWERTNAFGQSMNSNVTSFYRELLAFRKREKTLVYGDFKVLRKKRNVFTFSRRLLEDGQAKTVIIDLNLSAEKVKRYDKINRNKNVIFDEAGTENHYIKPYGYMVYLIRE